MTDIMITIKDFSKLMDTQNIGHNGHINRNSTNYKVDSNNIDKNWKQKAKGILKIIHYFKIISKLLMK